MVDDLGAVEGNEADATARRAGDGESVKAHRAFMLFLGQPPARRSVAEAYRLYSLEQGGPETGASQAEDRPGKLKTPPGYFRAWSSEHRWLSRSRAHDAHAYAENRRVILEGKQAAIEAVRVQAETTGRIKQAFFSRVSKFVFSRLDDFDRRDRAAADAVDDVPDAGRREPVPTPTPVAEVAEVVRVMRAASLIVDSGLENSTAATEAQAIISIIEEYAQALESQP